MPSVSNKQMRFMRAEIGRMRAGKPTVTHMKESQLEDFARKGMGGQMKKKKKKKRDMY